MPASVSAEPQTKGHHRHHRLGLAVIAAWKIFKGLLALIAAFGVLRLVHKDIGLVMEHWITLFRADPENKYIHALITKVAGLDPKQLKALSVGTFIYATLLFIEGFGLWFEKTWAEYLTIIATASLIPFELYELARGWNLVKLTALIVNLLIVWYLARLLESMRRKKHGNPSG